MLLTRILFTTWSVLVLAGCSASKLDLRDEIDLNRSSFREKLAAKEILVQPFLACVKQPYGSHVTDGLSSDASPHPASVLAPGGPEGSINSPVRALIQRIRERQPQRTDSLLALQEMVVDLEEAPQRHIDLDKLRKVVDVIQQWHGHVDFDEDDLAKNPSRFAQLLLSYNKAYFGDLSFKVEPTVSGGGSLAAVKVTSNGFVDRSGNAFVFPGLSTERSVDPAHSLHVSATPIDSQRISADLARIFLEAFFDAAFRVPAVHGATALRVAWKSQEQAYPEFDAARPPIPLEALARVTRDAMRAEAAVTSLVGKSVRGGGLFGLHNETLAAMLETAAGVMAKKLVEHEGFCYFQVIERVR